MTTEDALLFVDANRYLELYRTVTGRHLLAPLSEQTAHSPEAYACPPVFKRT
jgi:hypothetical protein